MRWLPSIQWHLQGRGVAQSVEGRLCRVLLSAITPHLPTHDSHRPIFSPPALASHEGQRLIFARPARGPWWAALLDEAVALNAAIPGGIQCLSRNSRRRILPTGVLGNSARNSITLGCL